MKGGPEGSYYVFLMEHSSGADPYVCMLTDAGGGGGGGRRPIRRWTRTEKGLVVALSLSVILIIVVVVVTFTSNSGHNVDSQPNQRQTTCGTAECVRVAGEVLAKADQSVDPCTDFYAFACGGWLDKVLLPPDRPRFGVASQLVEHNQLRLKAIMENPDDRLHGKPSLTVRKAKRFYNACLHAEDLAGGSRQILQVIGRMGSWTVTNDVISGGWDAARWSLEDALFKANQHQVWPLFDRDVRQDMRNSQHMIITFSEPHLSAPDPVYYFGAPSATFRAAFIQLFCQVALSLGAENKTARQAAENLWDFERRLAGIIGSKDHSSDQAEMYRKMKLQDLQELTGDWIDLGLYLSKVHAGHVPPNENVLVLAVDYMRQLGHVARNTTRGTIANYINWRVINSLIEHAGIDFRSARLKFKQTNWGVSDLGASWDLCLDRTTQVMGQATGALFAERFLSEQGKKKAAELLRLLKSAFLSELPEVDWMGTETKSRAAAKLAAMVDRVGYPALAAHPVGLDLYYRKLNVTTKDGFTNWLAAVRFHFERTRDKRGKPRDRTDWGYTSPTAVNAFYHQKDNAMMFPAGILRPPFFDLSFPMAMNLGAIGTVMAHELTHGFDDQGRQYDEWGSLKDWWDNSSAKAFKEKTKCFIQQYEQYKVNGDRVNGYLTLSENLADSGAVRTAYRAYDQWLAGQGDQETEARLPGANTTEKQTFFLAFAQLYCTYYTPEFAKRSLYTDPHAPTQFRVIGALSNSQEFSKAFGCRLKSRMHPTRKCKIW